MFLWHSSRSIFPVTINTISQSTEISCIKLSYSCMPNMNNVIQKYNYTITKSPAPSTTKTCNCRRKTDCSMDITVFLNALFTKHLLLQLLINIFMVLVKILSKNVTITTINVLLEKNVLKRTLNYPSMYGNWKKEMLIILLIGILLWNRRIMFVDHESVIYALVWRCLLQEQILMFFSINLMTLS